MPEPDFERIAQRLAEGMGAPAEAPAQLAEELRLIWNARGAADVEAIRAYNSDDELKRIVRNLDR